MKKFYSASTGGFYAQGVHASMPEDAVEISLEQHRELLEGQSAGKRITADAHGRPVLADPEPSSEAELSRKARFDRDRLLSACDFQMLSDAPGGEARRASWAVYRQLLRDITTQPNFPNEVTWPVPPTS